MYFCVYDFTKTCDACGGCGKFGISDEEPEKIVYAKCECCGKWIYGKDECYVLNVGKKDIMICQNCIDNAYHEELKEVLEDE